MVRRIGILTGGGDAPGLNAVIRAVYKVLDLEGIEVYGFKNGWSGPLNGIIEKITPDMVSGIHRQGGTILGSSRTNVFNREKYPDGPEMVVRNMSRLGLEGLIALGGEDTLGAARQFKEMGVNVLGVPKTIDNDIPGTDYCFGFDTAVTSATCFLDNCRDTARSHGIIDVVEIMGRHAGWITLKSGVASGADVIIIPEVSISLDEILKALENRRSRGKKHAIIAVSEGAEIPGLDFTDNGLDEFNHPKLEERAIGKKLAKFIKSQTGIDTRSNVPGHFLRGGSPTPRDRFLGTELGAQAAIMAVNRDYGYMIAVKGDDVEPVDLGVVRGIKTVPSEKYWRAVKMSSMVSS
ncbi:MAG: 6-phosphofructokinase [Ignavibacteriales bacterium]